jgi:hypothetical protein
MAQLPAPINREALNRARDAIYSLIPTFTHLPEDVKNTITNIYYEDSLMKMELLQKNALPKQLREAKTLLKGLQAFGEDTAFLHAALATIPEIVAPISSLLQTGNRASEDALNLFRDMFKYRIPDIDKKTGLRVKLERLIYSKRVKEIPNLWMLMRPLFSYDTP